MTTTSRKIKLAPVFHGQNKNPGNRNPRSEATSLGPEHSPGGFPTGAAPPCPCMPYLRGASKAPLKAGLQAPSPFLHHPLCSSHYSHHVLPCPLHVSPFISITSILSIPLYSSRSLPFLSQPQLISERHTPGQWSASGCVL